MPSQHETQKADSRSETLADKLQAVKANLGAAVQTLTVLPYNYSDALAAAMSVFSNALYLPCGSPELKEGLRNLNEALQTQEANPAETFTALMLADLLTYQSSLPLERRVNLHTSGPRRTKQLTGLLLSFGPRRFDETSIEEHNRLVQRISDVQEKINKALDHPPKDSEEMERQLSLTDARDQLEGRASTPYLLFKKFGSPLMKRWIKKVHERGIDLIGDPLAAELLLQGRLENMHLGLRAIVWASPIINKIVVDETDRDDRRFQAVVEYFFSHPEFHKPFWEVFSFDNPVQLPEHASSTLGVKQLLNGHPIIEWLFLQEPTSMMLENFLSTVPVDAYNREQKESLIRRLLGVYLIFRRRFPEHPNSSNAPPFPELGNVGPLNDVFAIIENEKPGVIYLDQNNEARAQMPRPGQTKEAFLAQERKRGLEIVYIPNAPWPEPQPREIGRSGNHQENQSSPKKEEPVLTVTPASIEFLDHWGGVGVLESEDIARVVTAFSEKLHISAEGALDELNAQINSPHESLDHVILPSILPSRHALHRLSDVGVVAVVRNGDEVTILINPQKAKLNLDGTLPLLAIRAKLNKDNELMFENDDVDNETDYTPSHLLMNAAAVLARATGQSKTSIRKPKAPFSQDELHRIYGAIERWNSEATRDGLPHLRFDEKSTDGPKVLLPIDTKFAFLTFVAR